MTKKENRIEWDQVDEQYLNKLDQQKTYKHLKKYLEELPPFSFEEEKRGTDRHN